jgi:hypothetical protein
MKAAAQGGKLVKVFFAKPICLQKKGYRFTWQP